MEIAGGRWRYRDKKVYRRMKCRYSCVNWKLSIQKWKYIFFAKMHVQKEKKNFDRHGLRPQHNIHHLPVPPLFSQCTLPFIKKKSNSYYSVVDAVLSRLVYRNTFYLQKTAIRITEYSNGISPNFSVLYMI